MPFITQEKYIVNKKMNIDVRYKIRNGQVIIDLKELIDNVLDNEEIGKYKTNKMSLNIPFDLNKQVSGNTVNLVIDKTRYTIRIKALEILPSKQQKIDYDNTHPNRWTVPNWIKLIEDLYYQTYGIKAMELDLRGVGGNVKRGKVYANIKRLKDKILSAKGFNFSEKDIVEYIRWAFTFRAKFNMSLGLLQSDNLIQEWLIFRKRKQNARNNKTKKVRKWES